MMMPIEPYEPSPEPRGEDRPNLEIVKQAADKLGIKEEDTVTRHEVDMRLERIYFLLLIEGIKEFTAEDLIKLYRVLEGEELDSSTRGLADLYNELKSLE